MLFSAPTNAWRTQIASCETILDTVGGSVWRLSGSDESILEPHLVTVWMGGSAIVCQTQGTNDLILMALCMACSGHFANLSVREHVDELMRAVRCVIDEACSLGWAKERPPCWTAWEEVLSKSSFAPRCAVSSPHTASLGRHLRHSSDQHFPAWAWCYFGQ